MALTQNFPNEPPQSPLIMSGLPAHGLAQPVAKPPMCTSKFTLWRLYAITIISSVLMLPVTATNPDMQGVAKQAGTEYVKGFAKEGGKNTADYVAENGDEHISDAQRQVDNAKAQAQVGGVMSLFPRSAQIEVVTLGFFIIVIGPVGKTLWLLLRSLNRRQNFLGFLLLHSSE